jgi:hypothetical protein
MSSGNITALSLLKTKEHLYLRTLTLIATSPLQFSPSFGLLGSQIVNEILPTVKIVWYVVSNDLDEQNTSVFGVQVTRSLPSKSDQGVSYPSGLYFSRARSNLGLTSDYPEMFLILLRISRQIPYVAP